MAIAKKKKRYFDVDMPIIEKQTQLQAYNVEELDGRTISYDLTRVLKGKSIMLKLDVKADENGATSVPKESKVMPYYIRRAVRKGTHYVEDSFQAEAKDSYVRIKPFLITRRKVPRSVRKALRENARHYLEDYAKQSKAEGLFGEVLKNKIQKELSLYLKKTYPLSFCEIRVLRVDKWKAPEDIDNPEPVKQESPEGAESSVEESVTKKKATKKSATDKSSSESKSSE
ncbi:MAG: hypothetical protein ABEI74_01705 [Candidatus Pacearchaeota archaeon]